MSVTAADSTQVKASRWQKMAFFDTALHRSVTDGIGSTASKIAGDHAEGKL